LHITCIGRSQNDILQIVESFYSQGIRQLIVVRGDGEIIESGFKYASELISAIRNAFFDVAIYVAGYPERPEEFKYLQDKIACGVNGVITQICFNPKKITKFAQNLRLPTLPGLILPNEKTFAFAKNLNVSLPRRVANPEDFLQKQISKLLDSGFKHLHFYTLNNIQSLLTH
jgi:methylenetetrahydrofolate reductase (NADPH)